MAVEDAWLYPDGRKRERYGVGLRWRARWRQNGKSKSRSFRTKAAAERHMIAALHEPQREQREVLVSDLVQSWEDTKQGMSRKTREAATTAAWHVTRQWGDQYASEVAPSAVRVWLASMTTKKGDRPLSESARRHAYLCLRGALQLAVDDGHLERNPCAGIRPPKSGRREPEYMTAADLATLAGKAGEWARLVWLLGTCGLRIGEACGLNVGDVDTERKRLRVRPETSKSDRGRDVPVATSVLALLDLDRDRAAPLFTGVRGGRLAADWWRRSPWQQITKAAGREGMDPHELRHTAASLAIASGADVKMVQTMLGHRSAAMTLDLYGHLWPSGLDDVAVRMDGLVAAEIGRVSPAGDENA